MAVDRTGVGHNRGDEHHCLRVGRQTVWIETGVVEDAVCRGSDMSPPARYDDVERLPGRHLGEVLVEDGPFGCIRIIDSPDGMILIEVVRIVLGCYEQFCLWMSVGGRVVKVGSPASA